MSSKNFINIPIEYFFNFFKIENELNLILYIRNNHINVGYMELASHYQDSQIRDSLFFVEPTLISKILSALYFIKCNTFLFQPRKDFFIKSKNIVLPKQIEQTSDTYVFDVMEALSFNTENESHSDITVSLTEKEMDSLNLLFEFKKSKISTIRFFNCLKTQKIICSD